MKIVIIKYNAGNVQSVQFALQRLGVDAIVTDDIEKIQQADRIIFPGVGEARSTMEYLKSKKTGHCNYKPEATHIRDLSWHATDVSVFGREQHTMPGDF